MTSTTDSRHEASVRSLLERGFYAILFQPIFELATGHIYGFEGLLRGPENTPMANPKRLFCQPGFLNRDLLHRLDRACLERAVRSGRTLAMNHNLFLNVHGETLWDLARGGHDLFPLLDTLGIPPDHVVLEISENTDKAHVRSIARSLRQFRRLGIRVALDDVGARYPWLHHMLWLEPDFVKVDINFVRRVDREARKRSLLHALRIMANQMGATVVAEGVETGEERAALAEIGVELAQGYELGRPFPAEVWLRDSRQQACRCESVAGLLA